MIFFALFLKKFIYLGSTSRNENCPPEISEDRELAESECGKLCQKLQHSLWKNRIKFEDLILDVENLSKMSPFLDIELVFNFFSLQKFNNNFFFFSERKQGSFKCKKEHSYKSHKSKRKAH